MAAGIVSQTGRLRGVISARAALRGSVSPRATLKGRVAIGILNSLPVYDGDYAVTPAVEAQTMKTKGKAMADDVTVHGIPVFEVSNASGGSTVFIASEVEYG